MIDSDADTKKAVSLPPHEATKDAEDPPESKSNKALPDVAKEHGWQVDAAGRRHPVGEFGVRVRRSSPPRGLQVS